MCSNSWTHRGRNTSVLANNSGDFLFRSQQQVQKYRKVLLQTQKLASCLSSFVTDRLSYYLSKIEEMKASSWKTKQLYCVNKLGLLLLITVPSIPCVTMVDEDAFNLQEIAIHYWLWRGWFSPICCICTRNKKIIKSKKLPPAFCVTCNGDLTRIRSVGFIFHVLG